MSPLAQLLIEEAPSFIAFTKEMFVKKNPDLPVPTSEEIIAIYEAGYLASIAKDDAIIAANPE